MNPLPRMLAILIGVTSVCGFAADQPAVPASDETIVAKWQPVDLKFTYTPTTTYYGCDALASKLNRLFQSIGAHPKSQVVANGCDSNGPSRFAFVQFIGAVPVPASATALAPDQSASKQALLNRLGIPAQFESIEFASKRTEIDLARLDAAILEPGDCELLEQLGREVLPKFGTTRVRDQPRCFPGHVPLSTPSLKLDVLIATPSADTAPAVGSKAPQ